MTMTKPFGALFDDALDPENILFDTDSYKLSHYAQYPEGTEAVSSYIEARSPFGEIDRLVFFGLQVELARLSGPVVTQAALDQAVPVLRAHGFDIYVQGWQQIIDEFGGCLPIEIDALPEGTLVPVRIPQLRIRNTAPGFGWLVGLLETRLLRAVWYPTTVASVSHYLVNAIRQRLVQTDGSDAGAEFKLHDFGARGASSRESAALGGLAHLVASRGTDTVPALVLARNLYGADMAGFSIPATEHSTMTALGPDGELAQMERFLDANPTGIIACVSDSYDLFRAIRDYWGDALKAKVMARQGTLVVRPDSGDPIEIVPDVIEALMARFGCEMTAQGYRLLPPQVRVIQGDGINPKSLVEIMEAMIARRLAIGNIAFGMGGALLQKVDRDSFGYAMKASAIRIDGQWSDVFKDPVTAGGAKTSKRGRQGVFLSDSGAMVARRQENIPPGADALRPVFRDGRILRVWTLEEVRAAAGA
ncbi:nicotinamide phosphoribosyltransferase [Tritonibacter scottomollicae]|uniref:Nicotinamide phosphoribosyltransferase n=2 Tax=Tritonibacter scottomollicae TaxID=483013 RepID=A0A2T1ALP2_TRISK|nr:nicotinamide phosphoribosyltransferase [Tritonibacter scottomollicae]